MTNLEKNTTELQELLRIANNLPDANGNSDYIFVNSIEECTDTSKKYVLPDGYIYAYRSTEKEVYTDILDTVGYTPDTRVNSSGNVVITDPDVADTTGYIPCKDGDIIRIKNMEIPYTYTSGKYWNLLAAYDANKKHLKQMFLVLAEAGAYGYELDAEAENGNISKFTVKASVLGADVAYIIINAKNITDDTEVYVNTTTVTTMGWVNTGVKYNATGDTDNTDEVPEYWVSELTTKADTIQQIMETAGSKKSAFLWYTDAHWQNNSKVSPALLKYLAKNTPMNKVNFGGDIICDPNPYNHDNIKYAYEWRKLVADLPNHHSVYGNHDLNHWTTDVSNIAYSVVLAPEETPNMVVGGDSYYYIDYPSEKTRYLYLSFLTGNHNAMTAQGEFIVDALKTVQSGWHIVVIAHRWYQYTSSTAPTVGSVPNYEGDILSVFDAYNARETRYASNYFNTQDFSDAKGKVEFCIGGHIHVDYNFKTAGGIPVILTASDANQERSSAEAEDCGTSGTITESAVYGIIADYTDPNNTKITIVGVGRGCRDTSNGIVVIDGVTVSNTPTNEIPNSINSDKSEYKGTNGEDGYKTDTRLNSSGVEKSQTGAVTSGFIPYNGGDIEYVLPNTEETGSANYVHLYKSDFSLLNLTADGTSMDASHRQIYQWVNMYGATRTFNADGTTTAIIPASSIHQDTAYIRVSATANVAVNDSTFRVSFIT